MSSLVRLSKDNDIAIITIDNPPVNALSPGVPEGIANAIEEVNHDPSVKAAILVGGGRTFVAGADIKEFGKMTAGKSRGAGLLPLLLRIENCSKPVVMAIHGAAFGGGLELAMAGHYRVASRDAQVGQPEVKLGLIPGAAGTQRLPRLVGVAKALEMCADGKPVTAAEASPPRYHRPLDRRRFAFRRGGLCPRNRRKTNPKNARTRREAGYCGAERGNHRVCPRACAKEAARSESATSRH
jgi:3-hydroxyacyl-CoA dehydrogenase